MVRAGLNQKLVAQRAGLDEGTVSAVMRGGVKPNWATVERLVDAIGTTWSELFEEAQMPLSTRDAALANDFKDLLDRLLRSDARQKERRRSRSAKPHGGAAFDDVVPLPNARIPEIYVRAGARRAYTVVSDAMIHVGILEGTVIYGRPAADIDAANGKIAIVRLNKTLFLKRIERRGRQTVLKSENPRYDDIHVASGDAFELLAIVIV